MPTYRSTMQEIVGMGTARRMSRWFCGCGKRICVVFTIAVVSSASAPDSYTQAVSNRRLLAHRLSIYMNPAELIRAANFIRGASKDEALFLSTLASFDNIRSGTRDASERIQWDRVADSLPMKVDAFEKGAREKRWSSGVGQLLLLASFSPTDSTLPPSRILDHEKACSLMGPVSRSWPVLFVKGIPYDLSGVELNALTPEEQGYAASRMQMTRSFFDSLGWAHLHARMENEPLRPPDNPFVAVNEYLASANASGEVQKLIGAEGLASMRDELCGQTMKMMEGILDDDVLVALPDKDRVVLARALSDTAPVWRVFCEVASKKDLRWNSTSERYALKDR